MVSVVWSLLIVNWEVSKVALLVKNPPTNAGDIREAGSIPGSARSPGESPWTEEPGRLQSTGSQRSWTQLKELRTHTVSTQ